MKNKNETKMVFQGIFYLKYVFGGPCLCSHLLHYAICSLLTGAGNAVSLLGLISSSSSDEIFLESFVLTFLSTIILMINQLVSFVGFWVFVPST